MTSEQPKLNLNNIQTGRKGVLFFSMALFVLLILIIITIYYAFVLSPNQTNLESMKTGALSRLVVDKERPLAPTDSFMAQNGIKTNLAEFKGSVILVNVWASWCAPCIREMPTLAQLSQDYKGKGLKVVAINMDKADNLKKAREKLIELVGDELEFYYDPTMRIAFPLKARGLPVSIIYDKSGREIARIDGAVEWQDENVRKFVDAAILTAN